MTCPSVQIESAQRPGDWFVVGLSQRFLETPRQRVAPRLLGFDRLLEQRLTARRFLRQDALGIGQFRFVSALRLLMRHDPSEIRVNDQHGIATRTTDLDFALQFGHASILERTAGTLEPSRPPGRVASAAGTLSDREP